MSVVQNAVQTELCKNMTPLAEEEGNAGMTNCISWASTVLALKLKVLELSGQLEKLRSSSRQTLELVYLVALWYIK